MKNLILFLVFYTSFSFATYSEGSKNFAKYFTDFNQNAFTTQNEIDPKYKWDLSALYENDDAWERDFTTLENKANLYTEFETKLGISPLNLLKALIFDEEVGITFDRLRNYASMSSDLDTRVQKYQSMLQRISTLGSKLASKASFMKPEIQAIGEETLSSFMKTEPSLKVYSQFFDNILRKKDHTLPKEQEAILALASPLLEVASDTFGIFQNADLKYPLVQDPDGKDYQITPGKYYAAMYSLDRDFRRKVYKGFYEPYKNYKNTFASLFNGNIKSLIFNRTARKYSSNLEASLDANNIPTEIYENLINSVNANLAPLQRWGTIKRKMLGLNDFHPYDTYVTLFPSAEKDYEYEEGKALVIEALRPLGEKYIEALTHAFNNRWVDVYETPGKRSGAYSTGPIYGLHPFVLLNWNNKQEDVFTLAHEMGHNMHSFFSQNTQPYIYADYTIFVAEVASTANEALLLDYLINNAKTKEEKLSLIEQNLNNITTTFYRQTHFAEFEALVNKLTEGGKSLTADELTTLFRDLYQKYWGENMTVDEEEGYSWARIPHFYYNFYVYQYATSFAASQALVEKIKKEGQPAIEKFLNFLHAGCSKYSIDILKDAGVDMSSPEPVLSVIRKMNSLLDELEELLAK